MEIVYAKKIKVSKLLVFNYKICEHFGQEGCLFMFYGLPSKSSSGISFVSRQQRPSAYVDISKVKNTTTT